MLAVRREYALGFRTVNETIACTLDIPMLAEAAWARGMRLVPLARTGVRSGLGVTRPSAAVLEWGSGEDTAAACIAEARADGWPGPLMLVLREGEGNRIAHALDAGADDAVALPVSAGEVAARIAARLRMRPAPPIRIGDLAIDPVERRVTRAGRPVPLLPREYALLLHLARRSGEVVPRTELLATVWGLDFDPGTNVVEVHVSRLRAKLDRGFAGPMLRTAKRRGYCLAPAGESPIAASAAGG